MATVLSHKVVGSLPGSLVANSLYYVRTGTGFDMYLTNDIGTVIAYSLNVASGTFTQTEKTLDFGTDSVYSKSFSWTHTGAIVGQQVIIGPSAKMPGTRLPDELEFDNFAIAAWVSATNTITAYATSIPGPVVGQYNFLYTIS